MRDFPAAAIDPYAIDLITPDEFLLDLLDLAPGPVVRILRDQVSTYRRAPKTLAGLLTALDRAGVPRFSDEVRRHAL